MTKETEQFLELIKENPDLPIVPMVDSEVVADDCYSWWLAAWGRAEIKEIYVGQERVHIKGEDDEDDVLYDLNECKARDVYDMTEEERDALYKLTPWTKCIAVYITSR